jgi:hypothetical protein
VEFLEIAGGDAEFFGEEALASLGGDEVDAGDARVVLEESKGFLGEDGAAGAGYANRNGE